MKLIHISLGVIILLLLAGCKDMGFNSEGRYSGNNDAIGNYIILDTKTGKVEVLKNDQLIEVPKERDIAGVKDYSSKSIPGMPVEIGGLRLKFRDGMLLYQGFIKPILPKAPQQTSEGNNNKTTEDQSVMFKRMEALFKGGAYKSRQINFQLFDIDGFEIITFEVTRGKMTRVVDRNSNPVHMSFEGSAPITPKNYMAISSYGFSWNLAKWADTIAKKEKNG